ncbi:MAG: ABC transporter substrate-binding protein, partial [Oscillospiraceae bacterium]|nr:ABC transporter substrate-binding protein [Oscillospiraceae bacterium]
YSIERSADATSVSTFVSAFSVITRVEALDERTVQIEIAQPDHEFLAFLTIAIIPEGHEDQARDPIGTGPFRFVSHAPQEHLILERFDDYWGHPAYLDRVTFRIFGSGEALSMALNAGAVDIAAHLTADMVRQLPEGFNYVAGPMNLVQALWLNNAVPPLDNFQVRRALAHAIDVQEIIDILFDGEGFPIGSAIPPSFTRYFYEELIDTFSDPGGHRENERGMAMDLLRWAGFPDGFDLTITVPSNYTPHVLTAEIIAEQLRHIGVHVTIDLVEWAWWLSEVNAGRNFQSTVMGIAARDLTARSFMERWVSDNSRNFINFYSPEYDSIFAAAQAATDEAEQIAHYRALQAILAADAASVFLQDLVNFVAINGHLTGWQFYSIYVMDLSTVRFVE